MIMLLHLTVISCFFAYASCSYIKASALEEVKSVLIDVNRFQAEALMMVDSDVGLINLHAMIAQRNPALDVFPSASLHSFKDEAKRLFLNWGRGRKIGYDIESENDIKRWFTIVGSTVKQYFVNGKDDFKQLAKFYMSMIILAMAFHEANKILVPEFWKSIEKEKDDLFELDAILGSIQLFTLLEDNQKSINEFVGNYQTERDIHPIQSIFKFMKTARSDPELIKDPAFKRFDFKLTTMIAKRQKEKIRHELAESKKKLLEMVHLL